MSSPPRQRQQGGTKRAFMAARDSYGVSLNSKTRSRSLKSCSIVDGVSKPAAPHSSSNHKGMHLSTLARARQVHPQRVGLFDNFHAAQGKRRCRKSCAHRARPRTGSPSPCASGSSLPAFHSARGPSRRQAASKIGEEEISHGQVQESGPHPTRKQARAFSFSRSSLMRCLSSSSAPTHRSQHYNHPHAAHGTQRRVHSLSASRVAMSTLFGHSFVLHTSCRNAVRESIDCTCHATPAPQQRSRRNRRQTARS
jgi:hypothetical protein